MGLRLRLNHPEIAALDCADCQRWIYDLKAKRFAERGGKRVDRPAGTPTPCKMCPKKSPQLAAEVKLTNRSERTLARYYESLATGGRCLSKAERGSQWLMRLFAAIAEELREFDRGEQVRNLVEILRVAKGI